jgi:two-component SAPR family response regulator
MNLKRIHTPVETNQWTGPVRIYTLGRFTLVINGFPVDVAGRVQKKPLLLLKAIVSLGGRDIREDQLSDILWPEADGDSGHNAFTTTLSRLRKLIQNDSAIQIANGRLSLNNRICWVDRWEFEKLCNQLELLIEEGLDDPMRSM